MSTVNQEGRKIVLPRIGKEVLWETIHQEYARDNRLRWKYLAMLSLQTNADWSLEDIGKAFGHPRGHIIRCIDRVKVELKERYQYPEDAPTTKQPKAKQAPHNRNPKWNSNPNKE